MGKGGNKKNRFSIGGEFHVEVPVPPSVLWQVVADVDSSPNYLSSVISVERLDGCKDDPLHVGSKWKEVRRYKGSDIPMIKTVHDVGSNDSPYPRVFAVNISFSGESLANTSTIIVSPGESNDGDEDGGEANTSLVAGTFAALADGLLFKLQMLLCGRKIRKSTAESFRSELDEIATEAKRRHAAATR